ncbi:MAG: sulfatase-like hydrolase/transferase, partial [Verrucomicrobiota bacterium]|nr:sulfatase-like hydrolase/transferase [Verrucomicrobiota bacterium]
MTPLLRIRPLRTAFLLVAGCFAALTILAAQTPVSDRPNVLIVLVDDAGYGDFGCHGHPFLQTPHIDRLHGESVRFTDFHVAPMCTP